MKIWIASAVIATVLGGGATGIAVAMSDGQASSPSPRHHNSAGCVPNGDGLPEVPDSCGPGNYPMSAFYRDEKGQFELACGDGPESLPVAAGEPDPNCHPYSKADMEKAAVDRQADREYAQLLDRAPAPIPRPGR